jgi:hypothetical protein
MEILSELETRNVSITVLSPLGALDSSNYRQLVSAAEVAYQSGERFLLIDFSRVHYMSSPILIGRRCWPSSVSGLKLFPAGRSSCSTPRSKLKRSWTW